jgi:hypothetical protein
MTRGKERESTVTLVYHPLRIRIKDSFNMMPCCSSDDMDITFPLAISVHEAAQKANLGICSLV